MKKELSFIHPAFQIAKEEIPGALEAFERNKLTDRELDIVIALYNAISRFLKPLGAEYDIIREKTIKQEIRARQMKYNRERA